MTPPDIPTEFSCKIFFAGIHAAERATAERAGQAWPGEEVLLEGGQPVADAQLALHGLQQIRRRQRREHPVLRAGRRHPAHPGEERAQRESFEWGRLQHKHLHGRWMFTLACWEYETRGTEMRFVRRSLPLERRQVGHRD